MSTLYSHEDVEIFIRSYLFIYALSRNALVDNTESYGIVGLRDDQLEGCRRKWFWPLSRHCLDLCLE
jgi:hypothetical protein